MPCMCGDTNCWICGPAQGHDPDFELVCDSLCEVVLEDMPNIVNTEWLAEELASRLGKNQDVADVILAAAKDWQYRGKEDLQ